MSHPFDFSDRIALVCGAGAGGVGTTTALMLAAGGATVVAVDRSDALVEETCARIAEAGGRSFGVTADLTDREAVATIVPKVQTELGRIDLVANIAGGTQKGQFGTFETTSDRVYDDTFALNLDYVFAICRDAGRVMIGSGRGGAIVNVASISALHSAPLHGPYGAAKAGLIAMTQTLAIEWGRHGIRANSVAPGSIRTPRAVASGAPLDTRAKSWAPLGRPVESEDVAAAIVFLLSDLSKGITGQNLNVDCGVSARSPLGGIEVFEVQTQNKGDNDENA